MLMLRLQKDDEGVEGFRKELSVICPRLLEYKTGRARVPCQGCLQSDAFSVRGLSARLGLHILIPTKNKHYYLFQTLQLKVNGACPKLGSAALDTLASTIS